METKTKLEDLASKPDQYVACRSDNHMWTKVGVFKWRDIGRDAKAVTRHCERCGAWKDTFYYSNGQVESARMYYPEGYLLEGVGMAVRKQHAVLESMNRTKVYDNAEDMMRAHNRKKAHKPRA